jgi:hypothetical protein
MARQDQREVAADLARGRDRFTAWRRTKKRKSRIPESLWELAVKLADTHGLHRTARTLNLDYYSLKKRVELGEEHGEGNPSFIELPPALAPVQECVIEFEDGEVSLRVHLKGYNATDVAAVGRSMRGSQ